MTNTDTSTSSLKADRALLARRVSSSTTAAPPSALANLMRLLAILFWATLAAFALATFLDPAYPNILDILNSH